MFETLFQVSLELINQKPLQIYKDSLFSYFVVVYFFQFLGKD